MKTSRRWSVGPRAAALAVLLAGGGVLYAGSAHATVTSGVATPVDSSANVIPLPSPAEPDNFQYTLSLPPQASCPGDTASDGYHVMTFVVPSTVDPGVLAYSNGVPDNGSTTYLNIETSTGAPYTLNNTAPVTGQIPVPLPLFEFFRDYRAPINLASGNYLIGVACATTLGVTTSYWDTPITLTDTGNLSTDTVIFDKPGAGGGGTTTTITTAPSTTTTSTTIPLSTTTAPTTAAPTTTTSTTVAPTTVAPTTVAPTATTAVPPASGSSSNGLSGGVASGAGDPAAGSTLAATGADPGKELSTAAGLLLMGLGAVGLSYGSLRRPVEAKHWKRSTDR